MKKSAFANRVFLISLSLRFSLINFASEVGTPVMERENKDAKFNKYLNCPYSATFNRRVNTTKNNIPRSLLKPLLTVSIDVCLIALFI